MVHHLPLGEQPSRRVAGYPSLRIMNDAGIRLVRLQTPTTSRRRLTWIWRPAQTKTSGMRSRCHKQENGALSFLVHLVPQVSHQAADTRAPGDTYPCLVH